jgi:1-acyl-sn-glycerol-3-phosphate acyltransferase
MPLTVALFLAGWCAVVLLFRLTIARRLARGPGHEPVTGLMWYAIRIYSRLMHRPTYVGLEHVPPTNDPGGLIVVSNHTCPVDPLLIQAACSFEIRWMMASDMMAPQLEWLWRRQRMIPVDRNGRDTMSAREAIRHVQGGGVLGIFPEGGIGLPRGRVRPFHEGVGLIIAKTKAPVLLVWCSDTPEETQMFRALAKPSRARVEFVDRFVPPAGRGAAGITRDLRQRLADASGWPIDDEPLPPVREKADPFAVA